MTLLIHILITSFICFGIHKATRQGMILHFIKRDLDNYLPEWVKMPLYECPICMGSFWSIMSSLYFGLETITDIFPMIPAVAGLNYVLMELMPFKLDPLTLEDFTDGEILREAEKRKDKLMPPTHEV